MDSLSLFLLDQGFPVEYESDKFKTPHNPKIGYVDCDAESRSDTERLLHLWATFSGDIHASPRNNLNHKLTVTSTFLSSNSKHDFCYTMANISPLHVQRHALLSPLSHNFKSFPYFFTYYETCSINVNSLFHAAIKNLHVKANGIFVLLLLHPPLLTTTISEGITHMRKNTSLRQKVITKHYTLKSLLFG